MTADEPFLAKAYRAVGLLPFHWNEEKQDYEWIGLGAKPSGEMVNVEMDRRKRQRKADQRRQSFRIVGRP